MTLKVLRQQGSVFYPHS